MKNHYCSAHIYIYIYSIFLCADSIASLENAGLFVSLTHSLSLRARDASAFSSCNTIYIYILCAGVVDINTPPHSNLPNEKKKKKEKKCVHTVSACMKLSPRSHSLARVQKIFMIPLSPIIRIQNRTNYSLHQVENSINTPRRYQSNRKISVQTTNINIPRKKFNYYRQSELEIEGKKRKRNIVFFKMMCFVNEKFKIYV